MKKKQILSLTFTFMNIFQNTRYITLFLHPIGQSHYTAVRMGNIVYPQGLHFQVTL